LLFVGVLLISRIYIRQVRSGIITPIILTSITTLAGLSTLIFFPSGQAVILQPIAISLGFGLFWGTILNLFYIPVLFALVTHTKENIITIKGTAK
jgi:multidrug efflux pump subunit AcrB